MGEAAHLRSRTLALRVARAVFLAALFACGEAGSTDPKGPTATAIALVTPFDSIAPLERAADDSAPSALSIQLRDGAGTAFAQAGRTLTLTVIEASGVPTTRIQIRRGATAQTDASGLAQVTGLVLSGRAGSAMISARVDSLPAITFPIRLRAGALSAGASAVTLAPDSVPVGGVAQVTVMPMDASGNKRGAGQQVTATLDGNQALATVSAFTYSAVDSAYRGTITVVGAAPPRALRASVNGTALMTAPLFTGTVAVVPPVPATALAITALPGDTTAGGVLLQSGALLNSVTVALRSASGAPVLQAGVAISASAVTSAGAAWSGATISGGGPLSTGPDGTVTFPALRVLAPVGSGRLKFTATGLAASSLPVRVTTGAVSSGVSTFTLSPDTVAIGAGSTAIVTLRDAQGNKVGSGQTVTFAVGTTGTSGITVGATSFTAADSTYRATLTGSTSGTTRTVTASVAGTALATTRPLTVAGAVAAADISATVNGAATFAISRFIYGGNFINQGWSGAATPVEMTFNRLGGNRSTAYNWETNYSNAGADFNFQNDQLFSSSTTAGDGIAVNADPTFARGQAFMATIPMIGYVAGDACNCNVGTSDADRANRLATHFKVSKAAKGSAFTLTPNQTDATVYQDEFVNWFESRYPGRTTNATAPVFFSLDNEPDIWHATHKEINSDLNDNPSTPRLQTYTGFSDTTVVYAKAIKAVLPNAIIFGPATATYAGVQTLGRYPSPDPVYGTQNFFDVYLDRISAASAAAGKRLIDVVDLHFYPQNGTPNGDIGNDYATQDSAMIQARVQAPRSLWDPTYNDGSWVTQTIGGPIKLIPRIRDQIAAHYPGTKIAITEYYYGRGGDISGGVAQADVLGIFGREGVFAASLWPNAGVYAAPYNGDGNLAYAYIFGAFKMFRNYDGAGSAFGDTGLNATTSDATLSSVYASRTSGGKTVLMVINKATTAKVVRITLTGVGSPTGAQVYVMKNGTPTPTRGTDVAVSGGVLTYTMPALSVTTLALTP